MERLKVYQAQMAGGGAWSPPGDAPDSPGLRMRSSTTRLPQQPRRRRKQPQQPRAAPRHARSPNPFGQPSSTYTDFNGLRIYTRDPKPRTPLTPGDGCEICIRNLWFPAVCLEV